MNRAAANVLLLLLGGAIVKIAADGTYLRYVKPGLQPWLLVAGIVMVGLALAAVGRDLVHGHAAERDRAAAHDRGGSHWLLLVPVAVVLFVVPPALGVDAATSARPATQAAVPAQFPPLPPGDAPELALIDVVRRAVQDPSTLDRRRITVTGFVLHTESGIDLVRMLIICCAADARPVRIHLDGRFGDLDDGTWLTVRGIVRPGSATRSGDHIPTLTVDSYAATDPPARPYEY